MNTLHQVDVDVEHGGKVRMSNAKEGMKQELECFQVSGIK